MAQFKYRACTPQGTLRRGKTEADSAESVREMLKSDGLLPVEIRKQNALNRDLHIPGVQRVRNKVMGRFCRQFAALLTAGIPMGSALDMMQRQTTNKTLALALYRVRRSVESGVSLSDSMKKEKDIFPRILCEMASVGEQSGMLPDVFLRMAEHYEKSAQTRNAVAKAMIYPAIVTVVVAAVLVVMMTVIVPRFEQIFAMSGAPLPPLTRGLIAFCRFFSDNLLWIALFLVCLIVGAAAFSRTKKGRYVFGSIALRLPLVRQFSEKNAAARISRTLSLLLASGIPILDALDIARSGVRNIRFTDGVEYTKQAVQEGQALSASLRGADVFPRMMVQMTAIGENTGQLNEMLQKCADYYDEETDAAAQAMLAALEPSILVVLIVIVAIVVFAIALPMFSMYSGLLG